MQDFLSIRVNKATEEIKPSYFTALFLYNHNLSSTLERKNNTKLQNYTYIKTNKCHVTLHIAHSS